MVAETEEDSMSPGTVGADDTSSSTVALMEETETSTRVPLSSPATMRLASSSKRLHLDLLVLVRDGQRQNGVRNANYTRYRQYLSRRIARLKRSLGLTATRRQPRRGRHLTPALAISERHLMIPLVQAERCWSCAMEVKSEYIETSDPRKRHHTVRKLVKATRWAEELEKLCRNVADSHTVLESQAYRAFMKGSMHLEKEQWNQALREFVQARTVYGELAKVGDEEHRVHYVDLSEQLDVNIRYCHHSISRVDGQTDISVEELLEMARSSFLSDIVRGKLEEVLESTRKKQAEGVKEIRWADRILPIRNDSFRLHHVKVEQLELELKKDVSIEEAYKLYEDLLIALEDCAVACREEISKYRSSSKQSAKNEIQNEEIQLLLDYTQHKIYSIRIARDRYRMRNDLDTFSRRDYCDITLAKEIARVLEAIQEAIVFAAEIPSVATQGDLLSDLSVRGVIADGLRIVFMAYVHDEMGKSSKGMGFLEHADKLIHKAESQIRSAYHSDDAIDDLDLLRDEVERARIIIRTNRARSLLSDQKNLEDLASAVQKLSLSAEESMLSESEAFAKLLNVYRSAAAGSEHIADVPPYPLPLPCKPIFLDLYLSRIEFSEDILEESA